MRGDEKMRTFISSVTEGGGKLRSNSGQSLSEKKNANWLEEKSRTVYALLGRWRKGMPGH